MLEVTLKGYWQKNSWDLVYETEFAEIPCQVFSWQELNLGDFATRFLSLYDQTYGSLHLTGRFLEKGIPARVLSRALELASSGFEGYYDLEGDTLTCLQTLAGEAKGREEDITATLKHSEAAATEARTENDRFMEVILPGERGWFINGANEEFVVEGVFYSPQQGCLMYHGRYSNRPASNEIIKLPVSTVKPYPESRLGWYDLEMGVVVEKME